MNNIFNAVYFVESSNPQKAYNPLAIKPTFYSYDNGESIEQRCEWQDTDRGAYFFFKKIDRNESMNKIDEKPPRHFKLISDNGEEMSFTYLTNEIFKSKVSGSAWGSPQFSNDNQLQDFYLNVFKTKT